MDHININNSLLFSANHGVISLCNQNEPEFLETIFEEKINLKNYSLIDMFEIAIKCMFRGREIDEKVYEDTFFIYIMSKIKGYRKKEFDILINNIDEILEEIIDSNNNKIIPKNKLTAMHLKNEEEILKIFEFSVDLIDILALKSIKTTELNIFFDGKCKEFFDENRYNLCSIYSDSYSSNIRIINVNDDSKENRKFVLALIMNTRQIIRKFKNISSTEESNYGIIKNNIDFFTEIFKGNAIYQRLLFLQN